MKKNKKYYLFQMNTTWLTIISTLLFIVLIAFALLTTKSLVVASIEKAVTMNLALFWIMLFGYLFLHELLHSLAYVIYGGKFSKIIYGIALEKGILYCLCKQNISRNNILHSLMFPLFFIGIVTYVLSVVFNLPMLLALSIFNLSGCSGDIIMFMFISKLDKNIEYTELDDAISFAIYSDKDVSKISHFGLNYIGENDSVLRNDFQKIKVSKASIVIIALLFSLSLILYLL